MFALRRSSFVSSSLPHSFQSLGRSGRLLARYLHPHRLQMALLGLILCGMIGVQVAAPLIASRFIDRATAGGALRGLIVLALLTMLLSLLGQGLAVAETWVAESVSWSATNALRLDLAAHLLRLDPAFHANHTQGELIERVDGDVATLARFFSRFVVYVLGNGLLMLGVLALVLRVDWRLGLGMTAFVVVALVAILRIRAAAVPYSAAERQASAEFYGLLGEYLAGLEDIRSSGAESYVLRRYAASMRIWRRAILRAGMRGYAMFATGQGLFGLSLAFTFALSAMLYREGALTLGTIYLVYRYTEMLRRPTEQIRNEVQDLQQADASLGRIEALMREKPRLIDGPGDVLPPGPLAVELDGVTFGYAPGTPVLRDISLSVPAGRVLGVAGRTGSGKTSLTRLLPRFYDPDAGSVRLGGVDVRDVRLAAVRGRIGLVSQEVNLFDASVRDNLTLFDDDVPDERVRAALETMGLGDWLRALPDGLDTRLGPTGGGLSAGQAQVLACARILLRDPDLVILDEASSRLDPATERLVHRALGRLLTGRTGIIVAHRLETFAYADDILVLEDGRVREHGPRALLAADPDTHFARLLRVATEEVTA
jgi:ABC-type multidrug transport system fused ATPase/permease subunit